MYRIMFFPGHISGGVGSVVMNIFRNIDREKYKIDFCVPDSDPGQFNEEILENGGRIFYIPQIRSVGPAKFIKRVKEILEQEGPYDAVHIHSVHMGALTVIAAKKVGIKKRIYHVHNTQDAALDHIPFHNVFEMILKQLIVNNSTDYLACGKEAGKYIYGNREYTVINNAVSTERFFPYNSSKTRQLRDSFGIDSEKYVVGNIARFSAVKNHERLVELAHLDKKMRNELLFLFVGNGEKFDEIKDKAKSLDCEDKIIFAGQCAETENMYNMMDVFCLPSLFEGLPVTAIEAQACGLPCVMSDAITRECDLGISEVKFLSLSEANERWLDAFYSVADSKRMDTCEVYDKLADKKYEMMSMIQQLEEIYNK